MRQQSIQAATLIALLIPTNVLAGRIFEVELDDLFVLVRYLIGFAFVVFGMFFLLYKDYATRLFLHRYDESAKVTGLVISCNETKRARKEYKVEVLYSAALEAHQLQRRFPQRDPAAGGPLLQQEYMHTFISNWMAPQGTTMDLYIIPEQPRSAITKEMRDAGMKKFSWNGSLSILVPGMSLAILFIALCINIISVFPPGKAYWLGWVVFLFVSLFSVFASWSICDFQFLDYALKTYFTSYPVQRRDVEGNIIPAPPPPATTVIVSGPMPSISPATSAGTANIPSQRKDPEGIRHAIV